MNISLLREGRINININVGIIISYNLSISIIVGLANCSKYLTSNVNISRVSPDFPPSSSCQQGMPWVEIKIPLAGPGLSQVVCDCPDRFIVFYFIF